MVLDWYVPATIAGENQASSLFFRQPSGLVCVVIGSDAEVIGGCCSYAVPGRPQSQTLKGRAGTACAQPVDIRTPAWRRRSGPQNRREEVDRPSASPRAHRGESGAGAKAGAARIAASLASRHRAHV